MTEFGIAYEITKQDYANGRKLFLDTIKKRPLIVWGMPAIAVTIFMLPFISREPDGSLNSLLLGITPLGGMLLCYSIPLHLPKMTALLRYRKSGFLGRQFNAHFADSGVTFRGDGGENKIYWESFRGFAESVEVCIFHVSGMFFIIPRRYLAEEHLVCIRQMIAHYHRQ